jgi:protein-L-isoaspartate(D-aspartate) O-methyltransferase
MTAGFELSLSRLDLACEPSATRFARAHAKDVLLWWAMPPDVLDDALLIVSELATNAVRHSGCPGAPYDPSQGQPEVRGCALLLALQPGSLNIAFHDGGDQPPVLRQASSLEENGRGLQLIAGLTGGAWGWRPLAPLPGKSIWARIAVPDYCRGRVASRSTVGPCSPVRTSPFITAASPPSARTPRSNGVTTESHDPARVDELREGLIAELRGLNALRSQAVEDAVRAAPRHLFVPEDSLEKAYAAERALVTKRDERGVALSSVSAARIQAFMLEQADIRPGMRVLEIGSGGYNAALIAELVGASGQVTTIDIDPDVIHRARRLLPAAGYGHVNALVVDGDNGEPGRAPYDRIVVTVEAAGLAAAWADQLTEDGRIVVPLRMRGLTRSVAFQRENGHLVGRDYEVCGFVPMRGAGARDQQLIVLHDGEDEHVGLRFEDAGRLDADKLRGAFRQPRTEAWSGVTMDRGQPYDDLDLWLATALDEYALLAATRAARDRGLVASASPMGVSTLLDEGCDSFAYLTMRPTTPEREVFEFGAVAHGPEGGKAADRLITQIQTWDRDHRGQRAELAAYSRATAAGQLPVGRLLEAGAFRLNISWPGGR